MGSYVDGSANLKHFRARLIDARVTSSEAVMHMWEDRSIGQPPSYHWSYDASQVYRVADGAFASREVGVDSGWVVEAQLRKPLDEV